MKLLCLELLWMLLLLSDHNLQAQELQPSKTSIDTIFVLKSNAEILLPNGDYQSIKKKDLKAQYKIEFGIHKVRDTDGYKIGGHTILRFYHLDFPIPQGNDGLGFWEIIEAYTSRLPNSVVAENGWSRIQGAPVYFVNIDYSINREGRFATLLFFNTNGNLSLAILQNLDRKGSIEPSIVETMQYLKSITSKNTHRPRFVGTGKWRF